MTLIEVFTDYIFNRKDLVEYVKLRKNINERGEFNDSLLLQASKNLERLKVEDNEIYEQMYKTLDEYVELDRGLTMEYPICFIREILKLYINGYSAEKVLEEYKNGLAHYHHDM